MLPTGEYKRVIPPLAKLFWSLFVISVEVRKLTTNHKINGFKKLAINTVLIMKFSAKVTFTKKALHIGDTMARI